MKVKHLFSIKVLVIVGLLLIGCNGTMANETLLQGEEVPAEEPVVEVQPSYETILISAVGDVMVHGPQLKAQYNPQTDSYNFNNNFEFMKPYIKKADLAIANLETTFGGKERGYSSFPMFNTPDDLADALQQAGFNTIVTINNHTYDKGTDGLLRTLTVLRDKELTTIGTRKNEAEKSYDVIEVKGIQVGITAFTYETPRWGQYKTLNAIKIPKEAESLIDSFSYEYLEEDLEKIRQRIEKMKNEGAELIVFYVHWGEEYQRKPNAYQRKIAQILSNFGVDIIFGSHPHVVQSMEIINSEIDQHSTLVVYSMGNFLSNQRYEIMNNRYTEDGLMVNVLVQKNLMNNKITLEEVSYIPTWVHRYNKSGKWYYEIIPVVEASLNPEAYNLLNNDSRSRASRSKNNTIEILQTEDSRIRLYTINSSDAEEDGKKTSGEILGDL